MNNLFENQALARPHAVAIIEKGKAWSYQQVRHEVTRAAEQLQGGGIHCGEVVAVACGNTAQHLVAILALAQIGATSLSLSPRRLADQRAGSELPVHPTAAVLKGHGGDLGTLNLEPVGRAIPALNAPSSPQKTDQTSINKVPSGVDGLPNTDGWRPIRRSSGDPLRISITSGATGKPKAVTWSRQQYLTQLYQQQAVREFGPGVRLLPLMGFEATVAVDACIRQLCLGGTIVTLGDPSVDALLQTVARTATTHILSTPGIIERYLRELPGEGVHFPDLRSLRITGGPVPAELRRKVRALMCSHIHIDYGATEAGSIAAGDQFTFETSDRCAGRLVPWIEAQAIDQSGTPLSVGQTGRLRFRHQDMPTHYGDGSEILSDGWFSPGDVGSIGPGRMLFIDARSDDVMNIGGVKVLPADIEEQVRALPGIVDAAAYAVKSQLGKVILVVAVQVTDEFDKAGSLSQLRSRLGAKAPAHLLPVPRIPRNEMGKVLRNELVRNTVVR